MMAWWSLLAGCFGEVPFVNEAPELWTVNDVAADDGVVWMRDRPEPGGIYPITVEVDDPEGDGVRVYFPESPGWVDFDPDARDGEWYVPETTDGGHELRVVLEDDRDPPARSEFRVRFPL